MQLRQPQKEAIFGGNPKRGPGILNCWKEYDSALVVSPTGTGKTVIFSYLAANNKTGRTFILAHRAELIWQAREKLSRFGIDADIEMADFRASSVDMFKRDVVIGSVQSMYAGRKYLRMEKFDPREFSILIVDEGHHYVSKAYRGVIEYFRKGNPNIRILFVTATPDRADEEALGQIVSSVAYKYEILDAINDGWLVPIEQQLIEIEGLDFSHVRTTAGDLNGADLAAIMESEATLHGTVSATFNLSGALSTCYFAASVKQAEMAAEIFNRHRSGCANWICGETPTEDRQRILSDYNEGRIQYICNVGVLTEGWDSPRTAVIAMGRSTKSRSLYAQMAGRGTRPWGCNVDAEADADARKLAIALSSKPAMKILDFVGNAGRHKLITALDILGGNYSSDTLEYLLGEARKSGKPMRVVEALVTAEEELEERERKKEERRQREAAKKARLIGQVTFKAVSINPYDALDIRPSANRNSFGAPLSSKQRDILTRQGIDPDTMPTGDAKRMIAEITRRWREGLASFKQIDILKKRGVDAREFTKEQASKAIDGIAAKEGWKKREPVH